MYLPLPESKNVMKVAEKTRVTSCINQFPDDLMPIVSLEESGCYAISLPASLKGEQHELEQMLNRLFAGRINSQINLALAQQLSLNWYAVKMKKMD